MIVPQKRTSLTSWGITATTSVSVDVLGPDFSTVGGIKVCLRQFLTFNVRH
jgi:hypothetical protein